MALCVACNHATVRVVVRKQLPAAGEITFHLCPECDRPRCRHCKVTYGKFFGTERYVRCPACDRLL